MIVKGKARSGPAQLAAYLMRSDEHATILDPGIDEDDLHRDFMIWDVAGEATRGEKTLYHCQIAPDPRYTMTTEQYLRSAQILAEDLGMADHPRRVVLHDGGDKPHVHVVFQRTDLRTMTMWDDSFNYVKHERASKRMALEFGHEIVPGKHAKRDREKQPEFPRQKLNTDEAQRAKRSGRDLDQMKADLAAMKAGADSALSFKAAVENAGFILANGDRGYTLVDDKGEPYNLARQLRLKAAEVKAYMASVPLADLPTAEQAQALQAERRLSATKSDAPAKGEDGAPEQTHAKDARNAREAGDGEPSPEKPKTIDPVQKAKITALRAWSDGAQAFKAALEQAGYTLARGEKGYCLVSEHEVLSLVRHAGTTKARLEAFMAPIPLDSLPSVREIIAAQREARERAEEAPFQNFPGEPVLPRAPGTVDTNLNTRVEVSALDMAAEAIADALKPSRQNLDPEIDAIEKAVAKRYQDEKAKLIELHALELRLKEVETDREIVRQLAGYKDIQDQQKETFLQHRKEYRTGIWGIIDAINSRWNPTLAAEKTQAREKERQNFYRRLAKERADYEVLLQQTKALEIENLVERQRLQLHDLHTKTAESKERYIQEHHDAKQLAVELEQDRLKQDELKRDDNLREGPPPPELGK